MTTFDISREEVESLADKLGSIEGELSDGQRALMASILKLADDAINGVGGPNPNVNRDEGSAGAPITVEADGAPPSLRTQFADSFTPGKIGQAGGAAAKPVAWEGSVKVSGGG